MSERLLRSSALGCLRHARTILRRRQPEILSEGAIERPRRSEDACDGDLIDGEWSRSQKLLVACNDAPSVRSCSRVCRRTPRFALSACRIQTTLIPWRGLRIPAMDGTEATQRPVAPGETFTYRLTPSAKRSSALIRSDIEEI